MDIEPLPPKVKSFKEAILVLEDVNHFLESREFVQASSVVGSAIDKVAGLKAVSMKQTTIRDFFWSKLSACFSLDSQKLCYVYYHDSEEWSCVR